MSFDWLANVDVVWGAVVAVAAYLVLLVWAATRPRAQIYRGAPDRARWRDLRLWIVPLVLVQVVLYWLLR